MQFVIMNIKKNIPRIGVNVQFVICWKLSCLTFAKSASVMVKHPRVLPMVPVKVNRKLGLRLPFKRFGGVNLAVRVVITTSIISIPM